MLVLRDGIPKRGGWRVVESFPLGKIVSTPGALEAFDREWILLCLARHAVGDWGSVSDEDKALNEAGLTNGGRLLSSYAHPEGRGKLWVITETDRSATTFLLPSEY